MLGGGCMPIANGHGIPPADAADDFDRYANLDGRRTARHARRIQSRYPRHGRPHLGQPHGFLWPVFEGTVIQTTKELPDEFPLFRWPNLHVLLHAQVSKLVNVTHPNSGKAEFCGSLFVAHASKEIILSAGARARHPDRRRPPKRRQNAHDHPTLESVTQNSTRAAEGLAQWNASHTGPFLPPDSPAFGRPHLEFLLIPGGGIGGISTPSISLSSPVSRGSITINSNDPFAPPLIDPGFLNSVFDLLALRDGVALAQRFVRAPVVPHRIE
ncbi:hypothetical protein B0H14DRAFT_2833195 [Mycena olivaceomarginata]|nr:hypothetical protein B0H14DRAFT_2833195 [Mycena olivaceomarginata]